ncbi:hypothetical protein MED01_002391 [Micromonospora sp. MED01]|uniref:hypothetical protein n=1 Tax=Micromonospora alfalfae TaxID=2911212 RepID=UPI001EE928DA|nr:hypothetical protein [Micromonospora alfalfae]MCG5464226.1 hypothetical protein [Micromonospora alfalfae]
MDDFDRLADDMDGAGDKLGRDVHGLVRSSTLRTEQIGKAGAPVLTGLLRSSITSDFDGGPGADVISGETGPNTSYDIFVHAGTSRQAPNPFMDRAADVVEPLFYAAAAQLGGQVLDG